MSTYRITLTEQELRVLLELLDIATRAAGLKARSAVNLICARIDARVAVGETPEASEPPDDCAK
jgi:hypothetical protein